MPNEIAPAHSSFAGCANVISLNNNSEAIIKKQLNLFMISSLDENVCILFQICVDLS